MLLISLLLTAIFFLVTKCTKLFCLITTTGIVSLSLLPFESVALAQGTPTLAPPDPNEPAVSVSEESATQKQKKQQSVQASDPISAPPLLMPKKTDRSNRFRATNEETLPAPKGTSSNSRELNRNTGPVLGAPSNDLEAESARAWTLPHEQHPWVRFPTGAWRTFRIESESFDETGISLGRSTTIRTESLIHVGVNHYQLQVSTLVDIGGKRLPGTPQDITLDLLTDGLIQPSSIEKQGSTTISLHGQAVPCTTWDLVTQLDRGERHELVYYSAEQSPHVLRRERIDSIEGQVVGQKTTNIVRDGLPVKVGQTLQPCRHLLVTEQFASGGQRECFEVHSDQIPGGLVESTEIDYGTTGQRVRWATTELIGAGLQRGVPLIAPAEAQALRPQVPQVPTPQLQIPRPMGTPFPWRGNRRGYDEDRDDDDDDDRDDDDRDDDDDDRGRDRDRNDDDDDDDDDFKPRRLMRLLRRAEVYLPLDAEPIHGGPIHGGPVSGESDNGEQVEDANSL